MVDVRDYKKLAVKWLWEVCREKDLQPSQLARLAGLSTTTLTRPMNQTHKAYAPKYPTLEKVSRVTGIPLPEHLGGPVNRGDVDGGRSTSVASTRYGAPEMGTRDLPIYGHARAGQEGLFMDNGKVQARVDRPHYLIGVTDGYGIYAVDSSMSPAFEHGWTVYVDPTRPTAPGDDVVIQLADDQAFIKRLKQVTAEHVVCEQFNPQQDVTFSRADVSAIHLIVGTYRG
jgi:phage repressor protein C with HTH and peptisase S24 domain